jgi:hypothetical protein
MKYFIEIIMLDENSHTHIFHRTDMPYFKLYEKNQQGESIEINVQPKDLYQVKSFFLFELIALIFKGYLQHFLVIVNEKGEPIKEIKPAINGKVLLVARDWKGLKEAVNDSFGSRIQIPRMAIVGAVVLAVIVIAGLIYTGYIPLPNTWSV